MSDCKGFFYSSFNNINNLIKFTRLPKELCKIILQYSYQCKYCGDDECDEKNHSECKGAIVGMKYNNKRVFLCCNCIRRHLNTYPDCNNKLDDGSSCTSQIKCVRCQYSKYLIYYDYNYYNYY
jgi:hypothetical protein